MAKDKSACGNYVNYDSMNIAPGSVSLIRPFSQDMQRPFSQEIPRNVTGEMDVLKTQSEMDAEEEQERLNHYTNRESDQVNENEMDDKVEDIPVKPVDWKTVMPVNHNIFQFDPTVKHDPIKEEVS